MKYSGEETLRSAFYNILCALTGKQDKLTGSPGSIVSFNADERVTPLTIQAGENVSVVRSGNVITISATGGSQTTGRIFTVTVKANDESGGTVSGGGLYQEGAGVTVTASVKDGYRFVEWQMGGSVVSTDASYTFAVSGDAELTGVFVSEKMKPVYHGTATNLSVGRYGLAAASAGSYAVFAGGRSTGGFSDAVDAYNGSLTRSTPSALSLSRAYLAAASVGSYAVFAGGKLSNYQKNAVDAYNDSLTRTTPTALSAARYDLAGASNGRYALFAGGDKGSKLNTADAYNGSLTRTTPTALSVARDDLAAAAIADSYILFAGGNGGDSEYSVVDAYNGSLTRTTPTALSVARTMIAGASLGEYALLAGGIIDGLGCSVVDAYDASLTRITPEELSVKRHTVGAIAGNYVLFGSGSPDGGAKVDVYALK